MPIWSELLVLGLTAYAAGFALGWAIWGRSVIERSNEE